MCNACVDLNPPMPGPDPMYPAVQWPEEGALKQPMEDVRATKPHVVSLRIVVEAEDARKAVERVLSAYDGTGIEVTHVSANERPAYDYDEAPF